MINMSFWKIVKDKWIRDNDPSVEATEGLIQKTQKTKDEIDKLNEQLNGLNRDSDEPGSLDDISSMMDQLNELGVEDISFGVLFEDL